ncbi:MAG: flagellin lysine-N-methylase [Oscillospiraceae bacterium]|nr:flagellin lysine-N-methylase [Oscillospiraceae bacterium]
MNREHTFLAPDFYLDFSCKCGDCRRSCCEGWNVGISQQNYFRILGMECSEELSARLARSFYIPRGATPERYALLNHDWQGNCPLRAENGMCALQLELGEDAIPDICRLYPRSVRSEFAEACLSNSCERVVEMLAERESPIRFVDIELQDIAADRELPSRLALRMQCIGLLQDRRSTLADSLDSVGRLLSGQTAETRPLHELLAVMRQFAETYEEISVSLQQCCRTALDSLPTEQAYREADARLSARFPSLELLLENLFVNHLFYEKFPFSETEETETQEYVSLCGMYGFLRYLLVGNEAVLTNRDALTDLLAATFRMMSHTRFYYNAHLLLHRAGMDDPAAAGALLAL